ncbi:MAG: ABC transporter permease [Bradymonadaceae bacterium]
MSNDASANSGDSTQAEYRSYPEIVWQQFKKYPFSYASLYGLGGLIVLALIAPIVALNVPFYVHLPEGVGAANVQGTSFPWFWALFDVNFFENNVDLFFNYLLFSLPLNLALWYAIRWQTSFDSKKHYKQVRSWFVTASFALQVLGTVAVMLFLDFSQPYVNYIELIRKYDMEMTVHVWRLPLFVCFLLPAYRVLWAGAEHLIGLGDQTQRRERAEATSIVAGSVLGLALICLFFSPVTTVFGVLDMGPILAFGWFVYWSLVERSDEHVSLRRFVQVVAVVQLVSAGIMVVSYLTTSVGLLHAGLHVLLTSPIYLLGWQLDRIRRGEVDQPREASLDGTFWRRAAMGAAGVGAVLLLWDLSGWLGAVVTGSVPANLEITLVPFVKYVANEDGIRTILPFFEYSYRDVNLMASGLEPSWAHWLGTDRQGRDVFTRIIYGTRISLTIGVVAVAISTSIGALLGSLAGYFGGKVDMVILRIIEVFLVFPAFYLILTLRGFIKEPSIFYVMGIIGIVYWTGTARLVRGEFLSLREEDFVEAAQALGLPERRVIFRHILPNALGPVLVNIAFGIAGAILFEATISFLGVGVPGAPSWGQLLKAGRETSRLTLMLGPGFALFLTVTILTLIGDGVRDAMDPKMRE